MDHLFLKIVKISYLDQARLQKNFYVQHIMLASCKTAFPQLCLDVKLSVYTEENYKEISLRI